ncbi:MAG TPA: hypothetical protein VMT20_17030 [Terriglobia bacterium]|nr:hypothetical protein [Terriglobia bacterium]
MTSRGMMTRTTIATLSLLTLVAMAGLAAAQQQPSAEGEVLTAGVLLTNDSIVRLTHAGISQEMIVRMVHTQAGKYAVGTEDVIALKDAGVSDVVLDAMLDHSAVGCGPAMTVPMELFVSAPSTGNGNGPGQPPGQPVPTPHSSPSKSVSSTGASATVQGTQAPVYHYGTAARKAPPNAQ